MEKEKFLKEVAVQMNGLLGCPVSLYDGKIPILYCEKAKLPNNFHLSDAYLDVLSAPNQMANYTIVDECLLYFIVKSEGSPHSFVVGPLCLYDPSDIVIRKIVHFIGVNSDEKQAIKQYLLSSPILPYRYIMSIMSFLCLIVNEQSYLPSSSVFEETNERLSRENAEKLLEHSENISSGEALKHTFYDFEQRLLYYVQNGQKKNLINLFKDTPLGGIGIVANTALRQEKNNAIISSALITRAAIAGGLSHEMAFNMSDITIQKIELCNSIEQIDKLTYDLIIDLTDRVSELKNNNCKNPTVKRAINYIVEHICDRITVEELASVLHTNRSFLSTIFKTEIGITLNEYINKQKIIEAKKILQFTNKSLADIATYLSFSSQSHFQNTFKKITGITPVEYRNNKT